MARSLNVQPITGAEVTLKDGSHLTLLAESRQGYSNLCRLISYAHISNGRKTPGLDLKYLPEHSEGLILLTGCRKGQISRLLMDSREDEAEATFRLYLDWFGTSSVFVELQQNLVQGDTRRNRLLAELVRSSEQV